MPTGIGKPNQLGQLRWMPFWRSCSTAEDSIQQKLCQEAPLGLSKKGEGEVLNMILLDAFLMGDCNVI